MLNNKFQDLIIVYNYSEDELKRFIVKLTFNPKFFNLSNNIKKSDDSKVKYSLIIKDKNIYYSRALKNISRSSILNNKDNIISCRPETFQLFEINLEQDFKSPLDNQENDRFDQDEFYLEMPHDSKFSPCEDKRIEMLENATNLWNFGENIKDVIDYIKSPRQTFSEDWESNKRFSLSQSKLNIQMDFNDSPIQSQDISFLIDKSALENKSDLKKQFLNDESSNRETNNLSISNMGKKLIIQVNQLNNLNIIQHQKSPVTQSKTNSKEKKDYVKLRIKEEIKSCLIALDDLRTSNASSMKIFKSDSGINNGIKILKKYLNNQEVINEYKVK